MPNQINQDVREILQSNVLILQLGQSTVCVSIWSWTPHRAIIAVIVMITIDTISIWYWLDSHRSHFHDHVRTRWWRGNGEGRAQSQQQEQAKLGEDNFCLCLFFSRKQEQNWVKTTSAFVNLNDDNQQNSLKTNLANHFQIRNKTQNYPKIGKKAKIFDLHPGGLVTTLTQRFEALERGSGWSQG